MSRILLVDDEPLATRTLQTLILDEMPELEVYSVNSAVQAMELLNKNVYDVVVTDVSMPRISGLELLDHIKKQGSVCYVIVLTAYNSFDYAYKASQYEDVRFVLKIEPPEVIMDAIRTGLNKIRHYYSVTEDNQRIRQYMKETLPMLRQTLLERLLLYGEKLPDRAVCESCGISIVPGRDTWPAVTGIIASQEKQREICFLVLSMLRDRGFRADAWYAEANLVFLVQKEGDTDIPSTVQGQLDRIIEGVDPGIGLSFVLSRVPIRWEMIGDAVSILERHARLTLENSRIVLLNPLAEPKKSVLLSDALCWRRYMEQKDLPGLMEAFQACVLREGYPQGRLSCALLMQMALRETFGDGCLEGLKADGYSAEAVLLHGSFDSLEVWLEAVRLLLEALFSGSGRRITETDDMLNRVNRYIQEHFSEQISLTQIAEQFNYNSSYLSRIYKQNMHEGLSEHIIRTRIEAACHLLQESGMSVSDIAGQCGFQTTKYFITVFKRIKGATPKSWRDTVKTEQQKSQAKRS